jgi:DnaJ domain
VASSSDAYLPDYYAVLQVHPDADDEVVAAAYRQLMKKYHPDVAGEDSARIAMHAARSKEINAAFRVLRDRQARQLYDSARIFYGTARPPSSARPAAATAPPPPRSASAPRPAPEAYPQATQYEVPGEVPAMPAPLALIAAAYYLLPGTYEWEDGQFQELLPVLLLPFVGTGAFALISGRLSTWFATTPVTTLAVGVVLLLLSIPILKSLPRVAAAAGPSAFLLSGLAAPTLQQGHIPQWLAWLLAGTASLALSARLYVFAVLPTLFACWLLTRVA